LSRHGHDGRRGGILAENGLRQIKKRTGKVITLGNSSSERSAPMKDQHQPLPGQQTSTIASSAHAAAGVQRHRDALIRTNAVWRRRAGAAIPLLLAIATAVVLG
jgi:hypothetical protein